MVAATRAGAGVTLRATLGRAPWAPTLLGAALALALIAPAALEAQRTHVLIVTGLGGEPRFSRLFEESARAVYDVARAQWRVEDSSLVWLAEDPTRDAQRIRARATRESVSEAFLALSRRAEPGDLLFVLLIGHGSGEGAASRVNLPGPDPTAADYASWLAGFARQQVVFVNAASASGEFVPVVSGTGRVIITATRSAYERNESHFGAQFARGLASGDADANKDGRTAVREAFDHAVREVVRIYETAGTMRTEHAVLSDTLLAARLAFGPPVAGSNDPRVRALVAERQALEAQLAALRERKAALPEAEYERELERILVLIAEKSAEIRVAGARP
jgi:hypothetical protein